VSDPVVIIGGGFAGAVTALRAVEAAPALTVTIVEPRTELGRGVAYGTPDIDHLVNGPAKLFGLYPDDPGHLPRWLAGRPGRRGWSGPPDGNFADSFPPRILYGDYIQSELAKANVRHVVDIAVDVAHGPEVLLASGRRLAAGRVILATGLFRHQTRFELGEAVCRSGRYVADPWSAASYAGVEAAGDVAIIGSGLSMLDSLISLEKRGFRGRYLILSRRGLLVRARREVEPWPSFLLNGHLPRTALSLLREVRRELGAIEATGDDWQRLVPTIRLLVAALWAGMDDVERRRCIRHLQSFWDLAFHRAVPESMAWLERVRAEGRLVHAAGRVQALELELDGGIAVVWRPRGSRQVETRRFDYVVNAAGYAADWRRIPHPLIGNLAARGLVRPHPTELGIEADPATGAVIDGDGQPSRQLFAVGHPLRGAVWESSSIVEQLAGATRVAQALARHDAGQ
jgi:uncharacterized NAD(P)/FAD-binding protein YdhS